MFNLVFKAVVAQAVVVVVQLALWVNVAQAEGLKPLIGSSSLSSTSSISNNTDFLPAEEAFQLNYRQQGNDLILQFSVHPDYYLYKERFSFKTQSGNVIIGQPHYNHSPQIKDDPEFGKVPVYHEDVLATLRISGQGQIRIGWQGCAEKGLCYPPQSQTIGVDATARTPDLKISDNTTVIAKPISPTQPVSNETTTATPAPITNTPQPVITTTPNLPTTATSPTIPTIPTDKDPFNLGQQPLLALFTLWLLGLGLAFTPCVLPMLPIVAGIVARQHTRNALQGFALAFSYALGVASSYAVVGAAVALFGAQANLALWLQHPVVLIVFSVLFATLALASFELFHLQLPARWQQSLDQLSQQHQAGTYVGSYGMGFFSALVVSPCVSAPLAGVLLSVSTLGDPFLGATALFVLGMGLSTPLMILGASEGRLLPKGGLWLQRVKQAFGVLLLGVSIGLLNRLLSGSITLFLWAVLSAGTGFWLNTWGGQWRVLWRSFSYIALLWAAALLLGAASGHDNPWQPLAGSLAPNATISTAQSQSSWTVVRDQQALMAIIHSSSQPVLVDVSAEWCISCKDMERHIFAQADIQQQLQGWRLVRADVTDNTPESRQLLAQWQLFGPPALLFFHQGQELPASRLIGEQNKAAFSQHLQQWHF